MHWRVLAVGKPRLAFARAGVEEYAKRLQPFAGVEIVYVKSSTREGESAGLLARSEGLLRVALDERGEQITSLALAARMGAWEQGRVKGIALLVGGAGGHTDALRAACAWRWSLSTLTLQHELALVVLLEQLYRAYTIKAGMPYHRE